MLVQDEFVADIVRLGQAGNLAHSMITGLANGNMSHPEGSQPTTLSRLFTQMETFQKMLPFPLQLMDSKTGWNAGLLTWK